MIIAEKTSFLDGVYHKTPATLESIAIIEEKSSDYKAARSKLLAKYFGVEGNISLELGNLPPKVCFITDIKIKLNDYEIESKFYSAIVGKIAGLCKNESGICIGLGIIRDFNAENGMVYVITPVSNINDVDSLEIFSGDGCISLEKCDIWSERLADSFEYDIPNIVNGAILFEKLQKYHPSRKFLK